MCATSFAYQSSLLRVPPPDQKARQRSESAARVRVASPALGPGARRRPEVRVSLELPGRSDLATAPWPRDLGWLSARSLACFLPCAPCPGSLQRQTKDYTRGVSNGKSDKFRPFHRP